MFEDIYKRIGFNLLKQRRLKGWTQEQLSERSGVSRSRISKMENGKENFNTVVVANCTRLLLHAKNIPTYAVKKLLCRDFLSTCISLIANDIVRRSYGVELR